MIRHDAATAECFVFTFKDGLLSSVAHDLLLRVERFTVEIQPVEGGFAIEARFDARSLRVVTAMSRGQPRPGALSASDRGKIERSIVDEVLGAAQNPEVRFASSSVDREPGGYRVRGELSLRGRTRALEIVTRPSEKRQIAEITLHQPEFGIKPYSAMLGTLKIKPDVRVRIAIPDPLPGAEGGRDPAGSGAGDAA